MVLLGCALYLGFIQLNIFPIEFKQGLFVLASIFVLFFGGSFIIAPGLNKDPENFVMRFLILTTVQMLAALTIIMILVFKEVEGAKVIGFHLISVFLLYLFLQSFLLIRLNAR